MAKKKGKPNRESTHERDLKTLERARFTHTNDKSNILAFPTNDQQVLEDVSFEKKTAEPEKFEYTLNYDSKFAVFFPNLITEEDEPDPLKREFINTIARGDKNDELDQKVIEDPDMFYEGVIKGISRWHYNPNKER